MASERRVGKLNLYSFLLRMANCWRISISAGKGKIFDQCLSECFEWQEIDDEEIN